MRIHICSCGEMLDAEKDGKEEKVYVQHNLECDRCQTEHACCIKFSPEHAVRTLRKYGYTVEKNT